MLIIGIVITIYGVSALDSFISDISRFFTGMPANKSVWFMIGGIVAIIIGVGGLLSGQPK